MISQINLISNTQDVVLGFQFNTPQIFSYTVRVRDDNGVTSFMQKGDSEGTTSFNLGLPAPLIGKYLNITWTVLDPQGEGNHYNANATVSQNGVKCQAIQVIDGTTSDNGDNDSTFGKFNSAQQ